MKTLENDFFYQPPYVCERLGDYDLQKTITDKWTFSTDRRDCNGNISSTVYLQNGEKLVFIENAHFKDNYIPLYRLISCPLAMYRFVCMFHKAPVCEDDPYKVTWEYPLIHKETGTWITFSEWKGAFGFRTAATSHKKLPEILQNDLLELLGHLISDKCAHPYDSLTAGSVA